MYIHRSILSPLFVLCLVLLAMTAQAKTSGDIKGARRATRSLRGASHLQSKSSSICEAPWAPIETTDCGGSDVFTETKLHGNEVCARCKPCSEVQSGDQCVSGETCVKSTYTCCDGSTVDMEGFHCSDGSFKQSLVELSPDCTLCKQTENEQ